MIYKTGMQFVHLLLTNLGNCYVTIVINLQYNRLIFNKIFEVKEGPLMVNLYRRCFFFIVWDILAVQHSTILLHCITLYFIHICILYSPGPVSAGLAHRMGVWSNPLKNSLIQHTSKISFVYLEKFPVIPEVC